MTRCRDSRRRADASALQGALSRVTAPISVRSPHAGPERAPRSKARSVKEVILGRSHAVAPEPGAPG